jgi:hypothetical protein
MKKLLKTTGWILLFALVIIQFIHPKKNKAEGDQINALVKVHTIPDNVNSIMKKACNDCHSNNTVYPWYSKIQPVDWWLDNHIKEGKGHFNLDELGAKPAWLRYHKMEEMIDEVKKGKMPLKSYTWIHKDAILTEDEKTILTGWAQNVMDEMKSQFPADSLIPPKRPSKPR